MVGSAWPNLKPFVLRSPSQFRPEPPISLESKEWAADYNEIKAYGGKTSTKRSAQQTETARFWLAVGPPMYHQVARQLVAAKSMSIVDSARFMALFATWMIAISRVPRGAGAATATAFTSQSVITLAELDSIGK
jgi:hypothetical protein